MSLVIIRQYVIGTFHQFLTQTQNSSDHWKPMQSFSLHNLLFISWPSFCIPLYLLVKAKHFYGLKLIPIGFCEAKRDSFVTISRANICPLSFCLSLHRWKLDAVVKYLLLDLLCDVIHILFISSQ